MFICSYIMLLLIRSYDFLKLEWITITFPLINFRNVAQLNTKTNARRNISMSVQIARLAMEVIKLDMKVLEVSLEEEIVNLSPKKCVVKWQYLTVDRLLIQHVDKLQRAYVERFRENSATKSRDITASRYNHDLL